MLDRKLTAFVTHLALTASSVALAADAGDLNPVTFHSAGKHQPVALVSGGKAKGEIVVFGAEMRRGNVVVSGEGGRLLSQAVGDLQSYIERSTGAQLPLANETSGKPAIVIGECQAAAELGLVGERMPIEGLAIKTTTNAVFIVGNGPSGTAWGIYEFLERFVGVRWYWPDYRDEVGDIGSSIVRADSLVVSPVSLSDAPAFRKRVRWPSGGPRIGTAKMTDHDRRLRCGNSWPVELIVHAPHGWEKYYSKTRPEIFQLREDGKRDFGMLCYGHPRTLKTYLEEIEAQLDPENPVDRGRAIIKGKAVTVSPADMGVSCRCEHCRALWNDEGGHYGTASRILATFVSKLARVVKKRWPDLTVIFLPYKNYTYAPESVEFPGNVEIQICGMPGLAQYKDSEINAREQANIDAWVRISGRKIQNWHYSCWPANRTKAAYLFPNTIQTHYQHNREKTVGSFINGVADHWPRQHLSLYVWLKVLWDPDINVDAIIDEYCRRMHGPAAKTMRELTGTLIERWENTEWSPRVLSPKTVYEQSFPPKKVLGIEKLLERAYTEAKGNDMVTRRLDYYAPALRAFFAESKLLAEGVGIKPLNVYQVAEEPTIDGKLEEQVWEDIDPVYFVKANKTKDEAKFPTELRAVWTRAGITLGFRMTEPDMDKLKHDIGKNSRDASLMWWNDNVEIFLDPTGERRGYCQFIVNPNGALYDSIGRENLSWDPEGVKAAGHLGKDFWSMEIFVPYGIFDQVVLPATGTVWYGNFTRHRVTDRKNREYQGFNITTGAPSHNQNAFGPIRFIER